MRTENSTFSIEGVTYLRTKVSSAQCGSPYEVMSLSFQLR